MSILTTTPLKCAPSASAALTVTSGSGVADWIVGSWVEFIASAAANLQLAGLVVSPNRSGQQGSNPGVDESEFDIGIGTAGNEVVIATVRLNLFNTNWYGLCVWLFPVPLDVIASGVRVAIRLRCKGTTVTTVSNPVVLLYYQGLDSDNVSTKVTKTAPPAATGVSIIPSVSAWGNSLWSELITSTATEIAIAAICVTQIAANVEWEVDLGTGGAGSEVVATTVRFQQGASVTGTPGGLALPAGLLPIQAGTRVACRLRRNSTSIAAHPNLSITYYDNTSFLTTTLLAPATLATWHAVAPTLTANVTLAAPACHATWTAVAAAVAGGAVTRATPATSATWIAVDPVLNVQTAITAPACVATWTAVAPTLTANVTLAAPACHATWTAVAPAIHGSNATLTTPATAATWTIVAPAVAGGAVTRTTPATPATWRAVAPYITNGDVPPGQGVGTTMRTTGVGH